MQERSINGSIILHRLCFMEAFLETAQQEGQTESTAPEEEDVNWGRFVLDIIETLVLAVVLFLGINTVSARVRVDGFSMRPTLEDGEFVLVNRMSYRFGEIKRGDIIVFHFPMNPREDLIKRVIGLPGDQIVIQDRQVYVNGSLLEEPYIAMEPDYNGEWQVQEGMLFVLGDNRDHSGDSRLFGPIDKGLIIARAFAVYWPIGRWRGL